jgi:hypothetical protein
MMKKILLSLAMVAGALSLSAQDAPNRMLVVNTAGNYTSYQLNNVEKLSFASVEGTVACDVAVKDFTDNTITVSATRSEACSSFTIGVFPGVIARSFVESADMTKAYMDQANSPRYYEDFSNGTITGVELTAGTEWAVVTQGYDGYGTPCEARAAYFTTAAEDVVGNPQVTTTVTGSTQDSISFKFVANADVSEFYYVLFGKGEFESQYEMFAPMYGFTNQSEMIVKWGVSHDGNSTYSYTYQNLDPNTEYELYIQALDANGNFAPMTKVACSTSEKGGSGDASVAIKLGDYIYNDWNGEQLPSQFVTFTPNDQTWRYRIGVYLADEYDADTDEIKAYIQSEPPMAMAYWWQYETLTTDYQINPNKDCVAIACAQNVDGVWGDFTVLRFTTPASVSNAPAKSAARVGAGDTIRSRSFKSTRSSACRVPKINHPILSK